MYSTVKSVLVVCLCLFNCFAPMSLASPFRDEYYNYFDGYPSRHEYDDYRLGLRHDGYPFGGVGDYYGRYRPSYQYREGFINSNRYEGFYEGIYGDRFNDFDYDRYDRYRF